jgi:hypothetical protein
MFQDLEIIKTSIGDRDIGLFQSTSTPLFQFFKKVNTAAISSKISSGINSQAILMVKMLFRFTGSFLVIQNDITPPVPIQSS